MTVHDIREPGPEPVATLRVRPAALRGAEIGAEDVPAAIDELTLVALLGCFAEGETTLTGAAELQAQGIRPNRRRRRRPDATGRRDRRRARTGSPSGAPGRYAAAASTLAATTEWRCSARSPVSPRRKGVEVDGYEAVAISYPRFERDLRSLIG